MSLAEQFVSKPLIMVGEGHLKVDYRAKEWCTMSYPGHPDGCPMYDTRDVCPPRAPRVEDVYDLSKNHWLVVVRFRHREYVNERKRLDSSISDKQARCVLYWQGTVGVY